MGGVYRSFVSVVFFRLRFADALMWNPGVNHPSV